MRCLGPWVPAHAPPMHITWPRAQECLVTQGHSTGLPLRFSEIPILKGSMLTHLLRNNSFANDMLDKIPACKGF